MTTGLSADKIPDNELAMTKQKLYLSPSLKENDFSIDLAKVSSPSRTSNKGAREE